MSLSDVADKLKSLCDLMSDNVASAVRGIAGTASAGSHIKIGADGTPTKAIDQIAEEAALAPLRNYGSGFRVLSEEMGESVIGEDPVYFIHLDPLDGTFNAIHGIPFYAISIFISDGSTHLAYVRDLVRGTKYYAEPGYGAYREDSSVDRINVSGTSNLMDFSISAYTMRPRTSRIVGVGDVVRRMRNLGAASLELCYVADGRLDAFIDLRGSLRVVDVIAGILMVEEAGGVATDALGEKLHLRRNMWERTDLIASNGLLHREILELIEGGTN
ncbi:MAG: bifunctional fructose-bisphosphatase/inositol-phosphate phosphatase [Methanothrix sp.]|jgi:myo-inositol-1(or 4)-monophosphatase|uniref:bifunctional fructose-bisphosphatase/inositol-phosphate phosphatase n=1 Tax=Methanothrix sp. TaxID=90426 RepID=UPI00198EF3E8|nr:bifunctional fructose-bisphosphatase/inositol-phosphate phosphatase [Methanothrix sp.]MBC7079100.1 bifunctional fructose-bisphosphatase/inositol-phosphate phosphatase [Methanothrix sp.]NPU87256.1 bifunctional fructose-bisphosphatase/inositol-phosphate phosphatase [Methanothrix sp.]